MTAAEVDDYIAAQLEPMRAALEQMRASALAVAPELEQVIAWKSAMFKHQGKFVLGLCAQKAHISFSPQSAAVLEAHAAELDGYVVSKTSFQVQPDAPVPSALVATLVRARIAEIEA